MCVCFNMTQSDQVSFTSMYVLLIYFNSLLWLIGFILRMCYSPAITCNSGPKSIFTIYFEYCYFVTFSHSVLLIEFKDSEDMKRKWCRNTGEHFSYVNVSGHIQVNSGPGWKTTEMNILCSTEIRVVVQKEWREKTQTNK